MNDTNEPFGPIIHQYTRVQAIADGVLVDVTNATDAQGRCLCKDAGFIYPIAITAEAFACTIAAGSTWLPGTADIQTLQMPPTQSASGRLWDLLMMLRFAIKNPARNRGQTELTFQVLVDTHGTGKHTLIDLKAICGPGDHQEPVLTILLPAQD